MSPVRSMQGTKCAIDAAIHFALDQYKIHLPTHSALQELLICARSRSRLLSPETFQGGNHQQIIQGLLRLFWYRRHWQRSLWEWYAPQGSIYVQFRSLANHLLSLRWV